LSVAKLGRNVYLVGSREQGNESNAYLLQTDSATIIIDTGGIEDPVNVIRNVLEISRGESRVDYLILTSCLRDAAAGTSFISEVLGVKVVVHELDSVGVRHGNCGNTKYKPSRISLVIRDNQMRIGDVEIIRSGSPTPGSILVKFGENLFVGASKLRPISPKIKYVLGLYDYVRV